MRDTIVENTLFFMGQVISMQISLIKTVCALLVFVSSLIIAKCK